MSGKVPCDIAVIKSGDLVYTDCKEKTVIILKNTQIQRLDYRGGDLVVSVVPLLVNSWLSWTVMTGSNQKLCVTPQRNKAFSTSSKEKLFIQLME